MAKKNARRRGKLLVLPVNATVTIGTAAENAAVASGMFPSNLTEALYLISADLTWVLKGATAGEGPMQIGLNHGDYTAAEVAEYYDSAWEDSGDMIAQEQRKRLVREVGTFFQLDVAEILNDGKPKRTRLGFVLQEDENLEAHGLNRGSGATTGRVITVSGKVYARYAHR